MADRKLNAQLQALHASAEALNHSSTEINTILATVETQLVESQIGIEVWLEEPLLRVPAPDHDTDVCPAEWVVELGFARLSDGWHIVAREQLLQTFLDQYGMGQVQERQTRAPFPIAQASRRERIEALRLLPALIAALNTAAQEALSTIQEAKSLILC